MTSDGRQDRGRAARPGRETAGRWTRAGTWTGTMLLAAALGTAGCAPDSGRAEDAAPGSEGASSYARVVNVEVRTLEPRPFTERIHVTGTVAANRDVEVAAEESGTVREILVEEGSRVREGQPLVRLDDAILRAELERAAAQAELARETYERNRQLYEEERAISELRYVETRARAREARAGRRALEERVARTVIRAPFDGVLETRLVEIGSMVSPGVPVARVVQLDPVEIRGGVPERFAPDVRAGADAEVRFDVLPDRTFEGRLSYVGSVIHPQNRTFRVELRLPNPDGAVKPEMVADVTLVRRRFDSALVVPQEALVREEDGFVAFVVEEGEAGPVATARPVEIRTSQRNEVVVDRGLAPGERLVVVGQARVADGDRVRIVGGGEVPGGDTGGGTR